MVKPQTSALLPFLRSDAVGSILAEFYSHPGSEFTISELARRTETNIATSHREISALVAAGVLADRRDGNNRLITVNRKYPLYQPLKEIILSAYGPVPILRSMLKGNPNIEEAFIFGSWAARREGAPGHTPNDIDVLVIGEISISQMMDLRERASKLLHTEINLQRVPPKEWAHNNQSGFYRTIKSQPLIKLIGADDAT